MKLLFLSVRAHRILDYCLVVLLAISPAIFGFESVTPARNVFWVLAAVTFFYSILTDSDATLARWLPLGIHRVFDVTVGYWLMISPQLFNYKNQIGAFQWFIHFGIGAIWILSGIFTRVPTLPRIITESERGAPIEHPAQPGFPTWVGISLAVNIAFAIWIATGPSSRPPASGTAPDNQVSQGVNPNAIKGFVTHNEMKADSNNIEQILVVTADPTIPAFHPDRLEARAGSTVCVQLSNPSTINHHDNFVLVEPGTEQHVGHEAAKVGPQGGYIPILPDEIIAHTSTAPPGGTASTCFRVPNKTGVYPFISSARNRWTTMKGVFVVKSANPSRKNTG